MAGTVTPSLQHFVERMRKGGDAGFIPRPVKAAILKDTAMRREIYGGKVMTARGKIRAIQKLQKALPTALSQKSAWTEFGREVREETQKQALAEKKESVNVQRPTADGDKYREKHGDSEDRNKEAKLRILTLKAEGAAAFKKEQTEKNIAFASTQAIQAAQKERAREAQEEKEPRLRANRAIDLPI